ncbi:MAG: ArsR family transcriptional regulator [Methanosarcinales archaeon Met12]|nr:MAG: ArsR family transcriptional regulator [Methanosarcinales archaeon Met12]
MPKRTRIINDPADLVPLFQVFGNDIHKRVFNELSVNWRTKEELAGLIGGDTRKSLEILQKGGLIESKWRMPELGKTPDEEFHTSYSSVQVNFQCGLDDLSDLIVIAFSNEEEFRDIIEKIQKEIKKENASMMGLCKALNQSPSFIRGLAKMSSKLTVKGQRLELAGER